MARLKRRALATTIAALAVLAGAGPAAATKPGDTEHGVNRKKLAKKAEATIEARNGIDVTRISRCGPQKKKGGALNFSTWICEWRASGIYATGEVPYACAGEAKWKRKKNRWVVEGCANSLQPQVPLLPTPNPLPLYGMNDDWANHLLMKTIAHALQITGLVDDTHSDVIRMNMLWSVVEKRQGTYDWSAFDQLNTMFKLHGMKPLWVILSAPCWAQPNPAGCYAGNDKLRPAPAYYDELARFSAAAAARYGNAIGFEVWNEPNYPRFWGGDMPDPADYSNMFKQVADAIHTGAPGMPVATGGLSPHADSDRNAIGFSNFVAAMYANGAAQKADAIGIHPYASVGPDEDYIADVRVYLGKIVGAMRAAGDATTPMWATEYGISTTGPHAFSPDQQATALADIFNMMRRVDSIPLVITNGLVDNPGLAEREGGWGLVNPDLTRKPAFCALNAVRGLGC